MLQGPDRASFMLKLPFVFRGCFSKIASTANTSPSVDIKGAAPKDRIVAFGPQEDYAQTASPDESALELYQDFAAHTR
jgi:hypothetical protein